VTAPDNAGLVLPIVSALVYDSIERRRVLLQRRDKPGEPVRGLLELPGGRWEAGERPDTAIAREVLEETGVTVTAVAAAVTLLRRPDENVATAVPLAVVNGIEGAFPSMHVLFECYGEGEPRPEPGQTADPRWWPVAEVRELVETDPGAFIAHTEAMLRAALGTISPLREPPPGEAGEAREPVGHTPG
jgi:8-oxo-dGTP pyrophosphatase MutT (NUDIX family)